MTTAFKECESCDMRGYSRELCVVHTRRCRQHPERRPVSDPVRTGARVAGGLAIGAATALLVSVAASFVGGAPVFHALLPKLVVGSGIVGGTWGLARSLRSSREPAAPLVELRKGARTAVPERRRWE